MADSGVVGSGVPTTRELATGAASALIVDSGFAVRLRIGEPASATVRIDDNIAELLEVRCGGSLLHLGLRRGALVRGTCLTAEVTLRTLEQATVSEGSRLRFVDVLTGRDLLLTATVMSEISGDVRFGQVRAGVSGASVLALAGKVGRLVVAASGASELRLADLAAESVEATLSGASLAEVAARDSLAVEAGGASVLRYRGNPHVVRQQATGASSIEQRRP